MAANRVEELEKQVRQLDPRELKEFRDWFADFEEEAWDRQIEADSQSGRLDALVQRALDAHAKGRSTPL